jgi:restriction endonuclease Mrr
MISYRKNDMHKTHRLTTISVSYENYLALKRLGMAGDSFNDVLDQVLEKVGKKTISLENDPRVGRSGDQSIAQNKTTLGESDLVHDY